VTTVSLADLTTRAKDRAAMENHLAVDSTAWINYINTACNELYRRLIRQHGQERFCTTISYTVQSNKAYSGTPLVLVDTTSWNGIISVHLTYPNGRSVPIVSSPNVDRDRKPFGDYPWTKDAVRYILNGTNIEFEPANVANGYTGTIRYVPGFTNMGVGGSWDGLVPGWDDYVVLRAAITARGKLRLDVSDLKEELGFLMQDMDMTVLNINRGGPISTPRRSRW
jgi:hypothetical protein